MDALALLQQQHREVEDLFDDYEDAADAEEKWECFQQIADRLAAHATIEERIFYPAVYVGAMRNELNEAVEEHLSAKRLIADLLGMQPEHPQFDAKVRVLEKQIDEHIDEEEAVLFKNIRAHFGSQELESMGASLALMFEQLMAAEPRNRVPDETAQAAPLG